MSHPLDQTFIPQIASGAEVDLSATPVLQVLNLDMVKSNAAGTAEQRERFRIVLNDGRNQQHGMVATQLNHMVHSGMLQVNFIIRILKFNMHNMGNRRIVVILNFEVVEEAANRIIYSDDQPAPAAPVKAEPAARPHASLMQAAPRSYPQAPNSPSFSSGGGGQSSPWGKMARSSSSAGAVVSADGVQSITPISELGPYQPKWTIKARITSKAPIKAYKNAKGEGRLLNIVLTDAKGDQIRATLFNAAIDKFDTMLDVGKVYFMSRMQVKAANKQYSTIPHDYELTMNESSEVVLAEEDASIGTGVYNIVSIDQLSSKNDKDTVDILGVVSNVGVLGSITTKKGEPLSKRNISVYDHTNKGVDLTLWGDVAQSFNEEKLIPNTILLVKDAKVSEYNGRSLNVSFNSTIMINPDIEEARQLARWNTSAGAHNIESLSNQRGGGSTSGAAGGAAMTGDRKTIAQVAAEGLGKSTDRFDNFIVKATVTFIKHDDGKLPFYLACPGESQGTDPRTNEPRTNKCGKKVMPVDGGFRCERCNTVFPSYEPRYVLSLAVADHTGSQYVNAFNEVGPELLCGKTAAELESLHQQDPAAYEAVFLDSVYKTYMFKCRARAESVQDELRSKVNIVRCTPVDVQAECRSLIADLQRLLP